MDEQQLKEYYGSIENYELMMEEEVINDQRYKSIFKHRKRNY